MYTLTVDGQSDPLRVIRYQGSEAISALFHFELFITSTDPHLPFADFAGKNAQLALGEAEPAGRKVNGMVRRFELAHVTRSRASYRVELVPLAHRLTLSNDCRIFQGKTVPEIIEDVLGPWPIEELEMRMSGSYAAREYCVQYRESDWDFVSRLAEEEGIFYFFEHGDSATKLVVADDKSAHSPISGNATVTYRPHTGALGERGETVSRIWFGEEVRTGKVTVRDYNFLKPALTLEGAQGAEVDDDLELYDYPANATDPEGAKQRAARWLEARQALRRSGDGESSCIRFVPGATFSLGDTADEDLRDDLNIEYLITRLECSGAEPLGQEGQDEGDRYNNRFWVIPSDTPFRPARTTPKARMFGAQTAVVVGPKGEEIHTDEHGRIKVQFHWDRLGKSDEHSSCWVRVQQPWAGPGWGHLFIPRMGQEVVVEFLEGDPDRPLVTGSVYHASNVPPYALPDAKTKSTVKSNSSIGGDGFNELRFEDQKGSEEIFIHAEKNWVIVVENDKAQLIRHDETSQVDHDRSRKVKHNETVVVGNDRSKTVDGNQSETIGVTKTITVGVNHVETIGANAAINIGGAQELSVGKERAVAVGGSHTEGVAGDQTSAVEGAFAQSVTKDASIAVGGNHTESVKKSAQLSVDKDRQVVVKGDAKENVDGERTIIVGKKIVIECGDAKVVIEKDGKIGISGKDISVKGEGDIKVEGKKLEVKSKGGVKLEASGDVKIKGSKVGVN